VDRSSAEGALVETPKAPRGVGCGRGSPPWREGSAEGVRTPPPIFLLFDLKMEHLVETSKAPRGVGVWEVSLPAGEGSVERARAPPQKFIYYLTSKWSILVLYLSWI